MRVALEVEVAVEVAVADATRGLVFLAVLIDSMCFAASTVASSALFTAVAAVAVAVAVVVTSSLRFLPLEDEPEVGGGSIAPWDCEI